MSRFPEAAKAARYYRRLGWQPLPSCAHRKMPAIRGGYARYHQEPIPAEWLDKFWTRNIQLVTGVRFGLAVVDLDGPLGRAQWRLWCRTHGAVRTWISDTGGGGTHLYFLVDAPCPTRKVWGIWEPERRDWAKHCFVEVLGDGALVVAPPSVHVKTGRPYRWRDGHSPADLRRPAPLPEWLAAMPRIARPHEAPPPVARRQRPRRLGRVNFFGVLHALSDDDKLDLAHQWGLRLVGSPNAAGWIRCHAIGREDRNPSASYHPGYGYYSEPPRVRRLSIFDCAVETGAHLTAVDALHDAASRLGLRR